MANTATCPKCDTTYPANDTVGHCSGCHQTFNGLTAFTKHQHHPDGQLECIDPSTQTQPGKFWKDHRGIWRYGKRMSAEQKAKMKELRRG